VSMRRNNSQIPQLRSYPRQISKTGLLEEIPNDVDDCIHVGVVQTGMNR
jgi:hypothetical protein